MAKTTHFDAAIVRKQHNGVVQRFVHAELYEKKEQSINRALVTLWHTGLSPHHCDTVEMAAEGAAEIIRCLRNHLENPPPDVQKKVLAMRGECKWTEDENANWSTSCGDMWAFDQGGPIQNKILWCPLCGLKVELEP